jgi:hypothetical protein
MPTAPCRPWTRIARFGAIALALSACSTDPIRPRVSPVTLELHSQSNEAHAGQPVDLTATLESATGEELSPSQAGMRLVWRSGNENVLRVEPTGPNTARMVGVAAGTAQVYVESVPFGTAEDLSGVLATSVWITIDRSDDSELGAIGGLHPTALIYVSGSGQSGSLNQTLPQPLVLRVLNGLGKPVANLDIDFSTGSGGVTPHRVRSDANGYARGDWTLGSVPGPVTAEARPASKSVKLSPVTFTATAGTPQSGPGTGGGGSTGGGGTGGGSTGGGTDGGGGTGGTDGGGTGGGGTGGTDGGTGGTDGGGTGGGGTGGTDGGTGGGGTGGGGTGGGGTGGTDGGTGGTDGGGTGGGGTGGGGTGGTDGGTGGGGTGGGGTGGGGTGGTDGGGTDGGGTGGGGTGGGGSTPGGAQSGIWISRAELAQRPTSGAAWDRLLQDAARAPGTANISDQDSNHDVYTLAAALVCARTGEYCTKARQQVLAAIGTETGGRWLAVGRNLGSYIIAADLLDLRADGNPASPGSLVEAWIRGWLTKRLSDNNNTSLLRQFGPFHAGSNAAAQEGFAYAAVAAYLGDQDALARAWDAYRTYACDPTAPDREGIDLRRGVEWGWAHNNTKPCGVNPAGSTKVVSSGYPGAGSSFRIDGAIINDMYRGGYYQNPPIYTQYPWVGLEGFVPAAVILQRAGYPAFQVADRAVLRTHEYLWWLRSQTGDVRWFDGTRAREVVHLINVVYGRNYPVNSATGGGRTVGYTDWSHSTW